VNFGVIDYGFVGGCIFNDTNLSGKVPSSNLHGLKNVRVRLRSSDVKPGGLVVESVTDSNGTYEFRNLRPGNYTLEIDTMTLPANFQLPAETFWTITVLPLRGTYFDIPVAAQRAVTGIVFVDKDGNGQFSPQKDEPVEGATIIAGNSSAISDSNGAYILRNLPNGKIKLIARSPRGVESFPAIIELGAEPMIKHEVNLPVRR
jgi:hypothetical protein